MKHWIDRTSESDNVIVANEIGLLIGSCDKAQHENTESQLILGTPIADVLGSEDIRIIPFAQIQSLVARDTDRDIDLTYRTNGTETHESLVFEDEAAARSFVLWLDGPLPATLHKRVQNHTRFSAATMPGFSLALCLATCVLYFDKTRLPVYIIGGLWGVASLWALARCMKKSPLVTRWSHEELQLRKPMTALKTGFACTLAGLIATGISLQLPDRFGERAVYEALTADAVTGKHIRVALQRGGDVNYLDEDGDTPLRLAISREQTDAAVALIESGARLSADESGVSALEMALEQNADARVIASLVARGGLAAARRNGFDPYKHVELNGADYNEKQLSALFGSRIGVADADL